VVDAGTTSTRQTSELLPYTANSALRVTIPLPINSSDAPLVNRMLHVAAYTLPFARLGVNFEYDFEERDNQARQYAWQYVRGDSADQPGVDFAVFNRPRDETTSQYSVEASLRLPKRAKLQASYEYESTYRNFAAVTDTDKDKYSTSYQFNLGSNLQNRFELNYVQQRGSTYEWSRSFFQLLPVSLINQIAVDQRWINHPALRQYHLADSNEDVVSWRSTWQPNEQWWLQLLLRNNRVRYINSDLGVRDKNAMQGSIALNYMPSTTVTLQAHLDLRRDERDQRGRSFAGGINKPANVVVAPFPEGSDPARNYDVLERSDAASFGLDLNWTINEKVQLESHYNYLRADTEYQFRTFGPALSGAPLPDVLSKMHSLETSFSYAYTARITVTGTYVYYRYKDSDYALADVEATTIAKVLSVGASNPNDTLNLVSLTMNYQF
jgi:hypothetical protein